MESLMERAIPHLKMAIPMKVNTSKVSVKDMELIHFLMENGMKVNGFKTNNTAEEPISLPITINM